MIYSSIASTTRNDCVGVGVAQVLNEMRKNVVFTASTVCNIDINALHSMILNFELLHFSFSGRSSSCFLVKIWKNNLQFISISNLEEIININCILSCTCTHNFIFMLLNSIYISKENSSSSCLLHTPNKQYFYFRLQCISTSVRPGLCSARPAAFSNLVMSCKVT